MGTEISLDIAGISLTSVTNHRGPDHGFLFQSSDRQRLHSDQIDYGAVIDDDTYLAQMEMGFKRTLRSVVPRIELLGFTLPTVAAQYSDIARASLKEDEAYQGSSDSAVRSPAEVMPFEEFLAFAENATIADPDNTSDSEHDADHDRRIMGRFSDEGFRSRLPYYNSIYDKRAWSDRSYFESLLDFMGPYALLRLLAENPRNLDEHVEWQYGPLVCAGSASNGEFSPLARRRQTYLIATEGTSDAHILKRAFRTLRPEIADFFRFIDVSERHPFSGTGNLVKFAEGLANIDIQNRVVFLLDNDAEGVGAFRRIARLKLAPNMRALTLPELDSLTAVRTVGPNGETMANINGRAAAIECYLDLAAKGTPQATVRWTSFNDDVAVYQGALLQKDLYTKAFIDLAGRGQQYDTTKLSAVLDAIVNECTSMATDMMAKGDLYDAYDEILS